MHQDTYRTINKPTEETLYKVKGVSFLDMFFLLQQKMKLRTA